MLTNLFDGSNKQTVYYWYYGCSPSTMIPSYKYSILLNYSSLFLLWCLWFATLIFCCRSYQYIVTYPSYFDGVSDCIDWSYCLDHSIAFSLCNWSYLWWSIEVFTSHLVSILYCLVYVQAKILYYLVLWSVHCSVIEASLRGSDWSSF